MKMISAIIKIVAAMIVQDILRWKSYIITLNNNFFWNS